MEFPPPDRHDRISRTCGFFARSRCTDLLPSCPQQSFRLPAKKSSRIKIHSPAAPGSYKKGTLSGAFLFGKDGPFRPAGRRAQVRGKGNSLVGRGGQFGLERVCLITRKRLAAPRGCLQPSIRASGTFAEKEAGRSGMRKARSRTGPFEWNAVHSDVG